jgi:hypothetical protein
MYMEHVSLFKINQYHLLGNDYMNLIRQEIIIEKLITEYFVNERTDYSRSIKIRNEDLCIKIKNYLDEILKKVIFPMDYEIYITEDDVLNSLSSMNDTLNGILYDMVYYKYIRTNGCAVAFHGSTSETIAFKLLFLF